jgi:hypothetical protein
MRKQSHAMNQRGGNREPGDRSTMTAQIGHSMTKDKGFQLYANELLRKLLSRFVPQQKGVQA